MTDRIDRRQLLRGGLLAAASALGLLPGCRSVPGAGDLVSDGAGELPAAALGATGVRVPILGIGTQCLGQRDGGNPRGTDWEEMLTVFRRAIEIGVTLVDTAHAYGRAQEAIGRVLADLDGPTRDRVFLATKVMADTADVARRQFEESLAALRVDRVDLLHLHDVGSRDVATVLGRRGAWSYLREMKDSGRAGAVGITGHSNEERLVRVLETGDVDVLMIPVNFIDHHVYSFETHVLEEAARREVGILAMKVFGGIEGGFENVAARRPHPSQLESTIDRDALRDSIRYVRSLPEVASMVIGVQHVRELEQNARWAIEVAPFDAEELAAVRALGARFAHRWGRRFG